MTAPDPLAQVWWLISRASGVVALVLVSLAVLLGLAMAARVLHPPAVRRAAIRVHEHVAVTAVAAISVHGLALLGDHWLKPGLTGITVPFALPYRPGFTGIGIISGYLIALLGPSFYLRRRIGARRWRRLHPLLLAAWILALVHTLGAGSDGGRLWLRIIVLAPIPAAAYLGVARLAARRSAPHLVRPSHPVVAERPAGSARSEPNVARLR